MLPYTLALYINDRAYGDKEFCIYTQDYAKKLYPTYHHSVIATKQCDENEQNDNQAHHQPSSLPEASTSAQQPSSTRPGLFINQNINIGKYMVNYVEKFTNAADANRKGSNTH